MRVRNYDMSDVFIAMARFGAIGLRSVSAKLPKELINEFSIGRIDFLLLAGL